jgi:hypothetical protein
MDNQVNQYQNQQVQVHKRGGFNMNSWSGAKKLFAFAGLVLLIVGIVVTILLVQRQQELRSRAEKSTTISLAPAAQPASFGDTVALDVVVNPGVNQVNFIKVQLDVTEQIWPFKNGTFEIDPSLGWTVLEDPVFVEETQSITFSIGVGPDPTKVIQDIQKIGTVTFEVLPEAVESSFEGGEVKVAFTNETIVSSIGPTDGIDENVLSNTVPATINIGEGVRICRPNIGTCEWDPVPNATSYKYTITSSEDEVIENETSKTSVEFEVDTTPGSSVTYTCSVIAVNECGESNPGENEATCAVPSSTPTPAPSSTPTPAPTSTPTPTKAVTNTPTPTEEVEVTATLTPTIPVATVTQAQGGPNEIVAVTATPTIPPPGNPVVIGGIIGGVLFVIGGLALLLL